MGDIAPNRFCSTPIGGTLEGSGCFTVGANHPASYCPDLQDDEWEYNGHTASNPSQCGVDQYASICRRTAYHGDPLTCCFQNWGCNPGTQYAQETCFEYTRPEDYKPDQPARTCWPEHRNITSSACQDQIIGYCAGDDNVSAEEWFSRWMKPDGTPLDPALYVAHLNDGATEGVMAGTIPPQQQGCNFALERNLFQYSGNPLPDQCIWSVVDPTPGTCGQTPQVTPSKGAASGMAIVPSTAGVIWGQQLMERVMINYQNRGYVIGAAPGSPGYHPFQEFIRNYICCRYPALCVKGLESACSSYTISQLGNNVELTNWCGCHLPREAYRKYVDTYQLGPECTPVCNRGGYNQIPMIDANMQPVTCQNSACIIDGISISLLQSQVSGEITIENMCSGCGITQDGDNTSGTLCSCIIEDSSIDIINSQLQGNIVVQNSCKSPICTVQNTSGIGPATFTVPCAKSSSTYSPYANIVKDVTFDAQAIRKSSTSLTLGILIAIVFVTLFIVFVTSLRRGG